MPRPPGDPRERLIEGMIAAAARHGYAGASVARVIERAGMSRATFYQHFATKDDCFLAAYRRLRSQIEGYVARLEHAASPTEAPRDVLAGLLATAEADPATARLVMIEALAAGPEVREEHEQLLCSIERLLDSYLDATGESPQLAVPARAILGGIGSVIAIRVFRGETGRLAELLDGLLAWLYAYELPAGQSRLGASDWAALGQQAVLAFEETPTEPVRKLPRGRGALSRGAVAGEHRDRILASVARLCCEKGYLEMTVSDIVAGAEIAREAFYAQFRSKEEAFLATQELTLQESVALAASAFFAGETWPNRVWNGLEAMLGYGARHPGLVCVDVIESYAAGPAAIRRSFDNRMAFTLFLEDGYRQRPEAERLPRICSEAIGGSILELLHRHAVLGQSTRLLEILPSAVFVALAPFIGPEDALRLVRRRSREARSGHSPAPTVRG